MSVFSENVFIFWKLLKIRWEAVGWERKLNLSSAGLAFHSQPGAPSQINDSPTIYNLWMFQKYSWCYTSVYHEKIIFSGVIMMEPTKQYPGGCWRNPKGLRILGGSPCPFRPAVFFGFLQTSPQVNTWWIFATNFILWEDKLFQNCLFLCS